MNYATAIVIAAALVASAILSTPGNTHQEPSYSLSASAPSNVWRINSNTGAVSLCVHRTTDMTTPVKCTKWAK